MFYVYLLKSERGDLYTGYTSDLRKRLKEHNQGLNSSTKRYGKWQLVYYEATLERSDATRREKYLKTSQGRRFMKKRLKDFFYKQKNLAD